MSTWFLRKPEGEIFGPVEQGELLRWASTDRIGPEDAVSSDRKEWLPAAQMPGLKLWWMIEWPDGHKAGPYHVSSLAEMLADGELDGNESVRHVHTEQAASLLQTLQEALLAGELKLGQGSLTAALCGVIRGPAMPLPDMQPAPVEPPASPVIEATIPPSDAPAEVEPGPSTVLAAAQRMHMEISESAEAVEEVLQHLPALLGDLKTRETKLAETEKRMQQLQAELVESRSQFATHQRMREDERSAARTQLQQREEELRQAREQVAQLEATIKQQAALETDLRAAHEGISERERTLAQLRNELKAALAAKETGEQARRELGVARQKLTDLEVARQRYERDLAQVRLQLVDVEKTRDLTRMQVEQQAKNHQQALAASQQEKAEVAKQLDEARGELEVVRKKLTISESATHQYEQNLAKLRLQLADMEEQRLQISKQSERKAAEQQAAITALENARDVAATQGKALQAERDAAVARAAERGALCEQMAADKRRLENQLQTELQPLQTTCAGLQQEKADVLKRLDEARQRIAILEQASQQKERTIGDLRQQLTADHETQLRELTQLKATVVEQQAKLQNLEKDLEETRQRTAATPPPSAAKPSAPSTPVETKTVPSPNKTAKAPPSSDLYCLPRSKPSDDF